MGRLFLIVIEGVGLWGVNELYFEVLVELTQEFNKFASSYSPSSLLHNRVLYILIMTVIF